MCRSLVCLLLLASSLVLDEFVAVVWQGCQAAVEVQQGFGVCDVGLCSQSELCYCTVKPKLEEADKC